MTIVEYILDPQDKPTWVSDGGYWMNPDGSEKLIGIGIEGSIPDGTTTLTLAELQARQRAIHITHPMQKESELSDERDPNISAFATEDMNDDEVNAVIKAWVDARN